ncbi:MAG: methyltransferase domain-containing protein [Desulfobacteraceae bacterium]|jgi:ubiquinone/menaquinone biosynthesis C-methylase UbiE
MANHVCPWWLAYTFDNPLRRLLHNPRRILGKYVRPGMTVLDAGCGMGHFSLGMARLVGPKGNVISADLQRQMLAIVDKRAARSGLDGIIRTRLCTSSRINVRDSLDFALAFWMVHETPEPKYFLQQIRSPLKSDGMLLIAEPRFHVGLDEFEQELSMAEDVGFRVAERPPIAMSHTALLSVL